MTRLDRRIPLPEGLQYREAFISSDEELALLAAIAELPLAPAVYRQYTAKRRILSFGTGYDFASNRLTPAPGIPAFLSPLRERVAQWTGLDAEAFSHALITEYQPGVALGWHRDVPQFSVVVGISLAGSTRMRFRPYPVRPNPREDTFALELAARSVYVLRDEARWCWQHSVPAVKTLRYSITFRTLRLGLRSEETLHTLSDRGR
ncbi:MAG TPA: alpha-ketoglutarate-dependent dioxygenase AlkB [Burkholderiales bacterium]|nr:alpha-ketoglutarate-dependent dioxygenase AlkB [Burkholderiales bacterium]